MLCRELDRQRLNGEPIVVPAHYTYYESVGLDADAVNAIIFAEDDNEGIYIIKLIL